MSARKHNTKEKSTLFERKNHSLELEKEKRTAFSYTKNRKVLTKKRTAFGDIEYHSNTELSFKELKNKNSLEQSQKRNCVASAVIISVQISSHHEQSCNAIGFQILQSQT